jgi:hypothetical protein
MSQTITNINNLLALKKNQWDRELYQLNFQNNPYESLAPKAMFNLEDGLTPQVITNSYELPETYMSPANMTALAISSGTGNGCDTTETVVKSGYTDRSYSLYKWQVQSEVLCLSDIQFDFNPAKQIANKVEGLKQYNLHWWRSYYQAAFIGMSDNKISTTSAAGFTSYTNTNYTFAGVAPATNEFAWAHANQIYDQLAGTGGEQHAVGMADGQPIYSMNLGPGYKRKLWQVDEGVRNTVDWMSAGKDWSPNFRARGINKAVYGFIPNLDLWPIRYDNSMVYIPPFLNTDATKGRKFIPNPAYKTVALGGNAVWEVITITPRMIFEPRVRPVGPTAFSGATFNAREYSGEITWINNKDMGDNRLGDKGFFQLDYQVAAKPIYSNLGFAILTLALDVSA